MLEIARKQHGTISRQQLLALGWSEKAIKWARAARRLIPTEWRGVYVVGRPEITKHGRLRAALLTCGDDSVLSDGSAGDLWGFWEPRDRLIHLSLPAVGQRRQRHGIRVHRRALQSKEITHHWGLRVTTPLRTVIDLAPHCDRAQATGLINAADASNLLRADALLESLCLYRGLPGVPLLQEILTEGAFVLTDSELERLFLPLAERAGLGRPEGQRRLGRGRVDFWFAEHNVVVECDSLRYHRTAQQQAEDRARDHAHLIAGRSYVRFTHHQIARDPDYVVRIGRKLRLRAARPSSPAASSDS